MNREDHIKTISRRQFIKKSLISGAVITGFPTVIIPKSHVAWEPFYTELACKPAGHAICEAAGKVINPSLEVKCLICPPDDHPEDVWCDWEFRLP